MEKGTIKTYDEMEPEEQEIFDIMRQIKLSADYARFKYHRLRINDLIEDYEQLRKLRENIQVKYFSINEELLAEDLIDDEVDPSNWGIVREAENGRWDSELKFLTNIKLELDGVIEMIESGEAEQLIIDEENKLPPF